MVDRAGDGRSPRLPRSRSRSAALPRGSIHRRPPAKQTAFDRLHDWLRGLPGARTSQREIGALCARHAVDEAAVCRELCMSWEELELFSHEPLVGIGAHSITHCNLAQQSERGRLPGDDDQPRADRRRAAARRVHLAYPYGDRIAAGRREFALAKAAGFKTAVTTRPGMIFPEKCRPPDRAAAGLAQRQLPGRPHPAGADLGRCDRDVERFQPYRRGVKRDEIWLNRHRASAP